MSKVQCLDCMKVIESVHRHDFKRCGCSSNGTFVDGGNIYLNYGGRDLSRVRVIENCGEKVNDPLVAVSGGGEVEGDPHSGELKQNEYKTIC